MRSVFVSPPCLNTPCLNTSCLSILLVSLILTAPSVGFAQDQEESPNLGEALSGGDPEVTLRYRYETVDEDAFEKDAAASTLRTTLSYRTLPWHGLSLMLEAENVVDLGTEDRYNNAGAGDLGNGVTDRPVIADPEITEVNQAYLRWEGESTKIDAGRQEFNWADQRFVGAVGWRQNHQTLDSLSVIDNSWDKGLFTYLFISNVNRIFGDNKPMSSHLLSGKFTLPLGKLDVYGLYLDYDRDLALSTATWGIEWTGDTELSDSWKLIWHAEFANQSDSADNPNSIDADYLHLMLGDVINGWLTIKLDWESLGGSPENGRFTTPLATLHKWNGWADKFLNTPENGLEDLFLTVAGKNGDFNWQATYHDFSSDTGGISYGTELDLLVGYKASWGQGFFLKAAFYSADDFATDTDKVWAYTTFKF